MRATIEEVASNCAEPTVRSEDLIDALTNPVFAIPIVVILFLLLMGW